MPKEKKKAVKHSSVRKAGKRSAERRKSAEPWHAMPLKGSFMIISILGFLITVYLIYPASGDYGIAFMVVFIAMFIASLISMTKAPERE